MSKIIRAETGEGDDAEDDDYEDEVEYMRQSEVGVGVDGDGEEEDEEEEEEPVRRKGPKVKTTPKRQRVINKFHCIGFYRMLSECIGFYRITGIRLYRIL